MAILLAVISVGVWGSDIIFSLFNAFIIYTGKQEAVAAQLHDNLTWTVAEKA